IAQESWPDTWSAVLGALDIRTLAHDPLGEEEPDRQFDVGARCAHGHGQTLTVASFRRAESETNLERLLRRQLIPPRAIRACSDSVDLDLDHARIDVMPGTIGTRHGRRTARTFAARMHHAVPIQHVPYRSTEAGAVAARTRLGAR